MDTNIAILASMITPLLAVVTNIIWRDKPNLRDGATLVAAVVTFLCVLNILSNEGNGTTEPFVLFSVMPGLDLAFNVEPLGLLFAIVASGLWIVTHLYGIGYMRGNNEDHHARFFTFFCFAISAVMGIAFAANMFTLFLFYEALTLSTYPLVSHKGTPEAVAGARTYLGILIGTSIGLLLVAHRGPNGRHPAGSLCLWHRQSGVDAVPSLAASGHGRAHACVCIIARGGGG
jgi:multicomponent Na+:H+ antiporter subunit D